MVSFFHVYGTNFLTGRERASGGSGPSEASSKELWKTFFREAFENFFQEAMESFFDGALESFFQEASEIFRMLLESFLQNALQCFFLEAWQCFFPKSFRNLRESFGKLFPRSYKLSVVSFLRFGEVWKASSRVP